jgi:hypothetical protein
VKYLPLTQGLVAQVSDEDFERVSRFKWHASAQGRQGDRFYACRFQTINGKRTKIWLHRFILGLPHSIVGEGHDPMVVDHKDGDGLNCQRWNIKAVPWSKNLEFVNGRLRLKRKSEEPWL